MMLKCRGLSYSPLDKRDTKLYDIFSKTVSIRTARTVMVGLLFTGQLIVVAEISHSFSWTTGPK